MTTKYSNSGIATFQRCPLAYQYEQVLKLRRIDEDSSAHHLIFGAAIHKALEILYTKGDLKLAKETMREYYPVQLNTEDLAKTADNACYALEKYWEHYDQDKDWEAVAVEGREFTDSGFGIKPDLVVKDRNSNLFLIDHKAQPLNAQILTPTGWVPMKSLKVGTAICNILGGEQIVVGVFPQGRLHQYEVVFDDGTQATCSLDHYWTGWFTDKVETLTLRQIKRALRKGKRFQVPLCDPVEFSEKDLPLPPYLLGALLGDGCLSGNSPSISIGNEDSGELRPRIESLLPSGVQLTGQRTNFSWHITRVGAKSGTNPVTKSLQQLYLWGTKSDSKFIPNLYKFGSVEQRKELLRGLMDTDGCVHRGYSYFDNCSLQLVQDIVDVARSLGGKAKYRTRTKSKGNKLTSYRVTTSFPNGIIPFHLKRKADQVKILVRAARSKSIVFITKTYPRNMQCIKVSSPDGLYITDDFTVTHNTTGSYLNYDYFSQFDPNAQITHYVNWCREKYGHCDGFIVNAIRFAFLKRASKDRAAGFNVEFERQVFQRTKSQIGRTLQATAETIKDIERCAETGFWRPQEQPNSCKFCSYRSICSAGWSWEEDASLILNNWRQICNQPISETEEHCQLDAGHEGNHSPLYTREPQEEFQVEV